MASESKVAVLAALVGNLIIALLKLVTGLAAGSAAMLAEAAHSFSDVGNQVLLMVGLTRSSATPTDAYPFGRGKSAYFWPFLVAVLLFGVAGAYSLFEGVDKVLHPHEVGDIGLALGVLGIAFVIEAIVLVVAVRQAASRARQAGVSGVREFLNENRDATLLTVIVEDTLALVGLPIAAAALVLSKATGNAVWDGIGSLVIGVLLMGFALFLGWEVRELLIGKGLAPRDQLKVREIVTSHASVDALIEARSMYVGPEAVLLVLEVDVVDELSSGETETAFAELQERLRAALPVLRFVYVEPRSRA